MAKQYFYAADAETESGRKEIPNIYEISTESIKNLTNYVVNNLEPLARTITEQEGYIDALYEYSQNNKEYPYSDIFDKIKSGSLSRRFFFTNITLSLLEKSFMENGINEKVASTYNKWLEEYNKQLNFSQEKYGETYKKGRNK